MEYNIPVIIVKVGVFIQTTVVLPYLARVRVTIATQVIRDRWRAAARVVVVMVEGSQRG